MERTIDRHMEQPPQAQVLAEEHARMLVEARSQTNRQMEVRARILVEARAQIIEVARARKFLLRAQVCIESRSLIFLIKVWACT